MTNNLFVLDLDETVVLLNLYYYVKYFYVSIYNCSITSNKIEIVQFGRIILINIPSRKKTRFNVVEVWSEIMICSHPLFSQGSILTGL